MIENLVKWNPKIHKSAYIHDTAVVIGRVKIGRDVSIWPMAALRGDVDEISVGEGSNIQDLAVLHCNYDKPVILGKGVTVGHAAVLHGCRVGNHCLIGMKAVVLEAVIGKECIIAAGALVTSGSVIPARSMVMGVPGKVVRKLSDSEVEKLHESGREYIKLSALYKGEGRR